MTTSHADMAPPTVLLTGASGLLGTWLRRTVPDGTELVALTHRRAIEGTNTVTADLRDQRAVARAVAAVTPTTIIHAAYALDVASIVDATRHVITAATGDIVHISTDAVFAGDGQPSDEWSVPDPVHDLGRWKASAERLVGDATVPTCIVRLPLVVSLDPEDAAVARIRAGAERGDPTSWFVDEWRRPAMAADIASAIWRLVSLPTDRRAGPWHLGGPERLSRHQIAQRVAVALDLDADVVIGERTPRDVVRPHDLDLRSERARREIGWDPAPVLRSPPVVVAGPSLQ